MANAEHPLVPHFLADGFPDLVCQVLHGEGIIGRRQSTGQCYIQTGFTPLLQESLNRLFKIARLQGPVSLEGNRTRMQVSIRSMPIGRSESFH